MTDNNNKFNHFNTKEQENSKKKTNNFLKGINNCFFHKNKTIGKPKNICDQHIFKKSNNPKRKNILFKEIILKCLQNLDLKSLGQAKQTCKEWKLLIETNEQLIWRQLCKRYWGIDHKRYSNNQSHHIYDVQWKELFLLNFNMHNEKYYFTSHHEPFQLGGKQKKERFNQTYLNINPYAFPNSQPSSYYPFPYPNEKGIKSLPSSSKNNINGNVSTGLLTPNSSSDSYSSMNSTSKNNTNANTNYPTSSSSIKENDSTPNISSSIEMPSSDSSTPEAIKLLDQTLEDNIEIIDDSNELYNDLIDDDNYFDYSSLSSSSPTSPPISHTLLPYISKVPILNKFSNVIGNNQSKKLKKKYLMVWPYGQSEPYTVTICGHYLFWIFNFRDIQVYDINTKKNVCRLKGHEGEIGLILSNHQHYIVSFDLNSLIIVWDIRNFSIKRKIDVKDSLGLIISMSVHRDRMVVTNNKGLIMVWNIKTGDLITTYKIPKEFINQNEEENFTNVALWNDYIAFALQSSVYFIYDISKNKCINIMYHPQNQRAQEMFHLIRPSHRHSSFGRRFTTDDEDSEDSESSNINQILAMINQNKFSLEEEENYQNYQHFSHPSHTFMEETIQETMMPNPSNSTEPPNEGRDVEVEEAINNGLPPQNNEGGNEDNEEELADIIARQSQYPFTLAINSHLLITNGPERSKLSVWSLKTGQHLYDLSESNALEKLDLHLPTLRMNDLFCELNFAEFSTDYSFIYTTIQYEQESSLAVWDFRSDQYPQKTRHFDIIDLNIDEQSRKFWIAYEYED